MVWAMGVIVKPGMPRSTSRTLNCRSASRAGLLVKQKMANRSASRALVIRCLRPLRT